MTCPTPDKVRHRTERAANRHMRALLNKGGSVDLHVYRCECRRWHVGHSALNLGFRIRQARRDRLA